METKTAPKRRKRGEGSAQSERKKLRSEGKEYTRKDNTVVPAKEAPKHQVSCKCQFKCRHLSYDQKLKLFNDFYSLKDTVKQNNYAMSHIHVCKVKRRRSKVNNDSNETAQLSTEEGAGQLVMPKKKNVTVCYTLPDGDGDVMRVCKGTFIEVLGLTNRRVQTLTQLKQSGEIVYEEKRGNKTKHRKYTEEDEKLVVAHINSIPRQDSHYSRDKSGDKQYLSEDLTVHRLFKEFQRQHEDTNITYRFYAKVFKDKFPTLKFHRLSSDTCSTCDLLKAKLRCDPNNKDNKLQLELHHRKAKKAMDSMKADTIKSQGPNSEVCTAAMDLQKVISLPSLRHSEMYYLRQLSNYNFCIHVGDNQTGHMFLWHEAICGRGGNEIASCVHKAFTSTLTCKKKLIMWSDNCCGQNKNKMMMFLWVYLTAKGYFTEIEHKFLVKGHSFMSCDRDFAHIEKRKRKTVCEVPKDLVRLITDATHTRPFTVTIMQETDFYDFKSAAEKYMNFTNVHISKAHWIRLAAERPGILQVRSTLNEIEEFKEYYILKRNVKPSDLQHVQLETLHRECRLSEEKRRDLAKVIPFVKEENKWFYEKLVK